MKKSIRAFNHMVDIALENPNIDILDIDDEVCEYCGSIIMDDLGCDNCEGEDA